MKKNNVIMKDRIISVDILRGICMLWIVVFWHGLFYTGIDIQNNVLANLATYISLATFTFLSGIFVRNVEFSTFADCIPFWKKRLLRLYPMYFIIVTIFYITGFGGVDSIGTYIAAVTGMTLFSGNSVLTVWYVVMLLVFYAITPMMSGGGGSIRKSQPAYFSLSFFV